MTYPYEDDTLLYTLQTTGVPRILTTRKDGEVVYVELSVDGNDLVEIDPDDLEVDNG
ncbi:hypothetical protein SEA_PAULODIABOLI_192 [Microbacterium phage PauloDiaboli]|nr:hypothetical protein SEA_PAULODIABOLI_192 [Microbacterium phage PauloDiaboli]QWY84000.1 hypothetical protein SEA_A3WALLY_193 [Microbacterium phage A3Wally]